MTHSFPKDYLILMKTHSVIYLSNNLYLLFRLHLMIGNLLCNQIFNHLVIPQCILQVLKMTTVNESNLMMQIIWILQVKSFLKTQAKRKEIWNLIAKKNHLMMGNLIKRNKRKASKEPKTKYIMLIQKKRSPSGKILSITLKMILQKRKNKWFRIEYQLKSSERDKRNSLNVLKKKYT